MAHMREKIKNFFTFIGHAWKAGFRGRVGIGMLILALFLFFRIFGGETTIQGFIMNLWHINQEQTQLTQLQQELEELERHNNLLQNYSPDYIEEIGLSVLNIGDSKTRILRF